jgi:hypothetical protein
MRKFEERAAHVDDASTETATFTEALLIAIALAGSLVDLGFMARTVLDLSTLG